MAISRRPNFPAATARWRCRRRRWCRSRRCAGCEAVQVMRATGLGAGAGEGFAAERLNADDGADHAAVDLAVADPLAREDVADGLVDAAVDAEGEASRSWRSRR